MIFFRAKPQRRKKIKWRLRHEIVTFQLPTCVRLVSSVDVCVCFLLENHLIAGRSFFVLSLNKMFALGADFVTVKKAHTRTPRCVSTAAENNPNAFGDHSTRQVSKQFHSQRLEPIKFNWEDSQKAKRGAGEDYFCDDDEKEREREREKQRQRRQQQQRRRQWNKYRKRHKAISS